MGEKRRPEILAPAGSMESLRAAVAAGCDAVYMGGSRFGARAFADNPQEEQWMEAIRYCHLYGVKIYLTVNTLLKEGELREELGRYLLPFYREGVDAVIVQDVGVMRYLHRRFPDLPLHASTQMTLTMGKSARLLEEYGVTRMVPARELTLWELQQMRRDTGLELEVFVHGALCYCYSGQCLFSSMLGGRSGNRGRCAQPCRMPYRMMGDASSAAGGGAHQYLFSLKENCALAHVGDLVDAGVDSFKIEGRMKRPEYTALTTAMYRKYLELYLELGRQDYERYLRANGEQWREDVRKLEELYNRSGFTAGYLEGGGEMLSVLRPKHGGVRIGKVAAVDRQTFTYTAERGLHSQDVVEVRDPRQRQIYEYTIGEEKKAGQPVTARYKKGCRILPGNLVYRTKDAVLLEEIRENYLQGTAKMEVQAVFTAKEQENMALDLLYRQKDGKELRVREQGDVCQRARKQPSAEQEIRRLLCQTGDTPFVMGELQVCLGEGLFLPVGAVKKLRRRALARLQRELERRGRRNGLPEEVSGSEGGQVESPSWGAADEGRREICIASVLTEEQFQAAVSSAHTDIIYLKMDQMTDGQLREAVREGYCAGKEMYLVLPAVMRSALYETERRKLSGDGLYRMEQLRGFVIRNMESFVFLREEAGIPAKDIVTDANLYVTNGEAAAYWWEQGCRQVTLPVELTGAELEEMWNGVWRTAPGGIERQAVVYGHIPLMVSAQCVRNNMQGCAGKSGSSQTGQTGKGAFLNVEDTRGREFLVFNACKYCYNILYQGEPLVYGPEKERLWQQGVRRFRYDFSVESPREVGRILAGRLPAGHKGHFYDGID